MSYTFFVLLLVGILTFTSVEFLEVMDILSRRLNDKGKNWRHVAKALTVLDFIVRAGSENVVLWSKDNMYIIKTLREFQYVDEDGHDQGTIIRVKAKELTSLLRDDERLRTERSMRNDRRRRRRPHTQRRSSYGSQEDGGADEDEDELARALEESRRTAEEEERRRNRNVSDDGLSTALQLSREEEEARRAREAQQQNLLDLSDSQPGQQFDIFGNPINSMNTGYLQNAYGGDYAQQMQQQQLLQQQQQQQEYLQQQQLQQQQQEYLQQQYLQQQQQQQQQEYLQQQQYLQYLQQQQLLQQQQQQQQLEPLKTGSNNPFAINNEGASTSSVSQYEPEQPKLNRTPTASQKKNEEYSDLNALLATGTGIDTFGNEGNLRIPAQFTKPTTFINSSGTGIRTENNSANPFIQKQYTGVASTGIVPSYTGYGFGNQGSQSQQRQQQGSSQPTDQSLIDI